MILLKLQLRFGWHGFLFDLFLEFVDEEAGVGGIVHAE